MKKFLVSFAVATMALISCNGANKMYGKYSFMMGKEKETHFGVEVTLSDKDYESKEGEEPIEGAKELELKLNLSNDIKPEKPDEDNPNYLEALFAWMVADRLCDGLDGYYSIKEGVYEEGQRLPLGFSLFPDILEIPIEIYSEFVENFIVAYYNRQTKSVKLILPTSLADLQYQLWWYGYYLDINIENFDIFDEPKPFFTFYVFSANFGLNLSLQNIEEDPFIIDIFNLKDESGEEIKIILPPTDRGERVGTHPKVDVDKKIDQVDDMNKVCIPLFQYLFPDVIKAEDYPQFRDYHSLTVDLQKQE